MSREDVYREMREMLGIVPSFFGNVSEKSLELEWELFRRIQLGEGAIPGKYRELIGLGGSSVIGCPHSVFFHKELAKLRGATAEEIEDAVHFAMSAAGIAAYFDAIQLNDETHRNEVIGSGTKRGGEAVAMRSVSGDASREEVYSAIEGALGLVPTPFQKMPDAVLPLEWELNQLLWFGEGPVPVKYRHLIGIAVGAAAKSRNSIFLHTEMAKSYGASQAEIDEAAYIAKLDASWAAYITAQEADFETFRNEILAGIEYVRSQQAVEV